jgi:hypothetical protein
MSRRVGLALIACGFSLAMGSAYGASYTDVQLTGSGDGSGHTLINALNSIYGATYGTIDPNGYGTVLTNQTLITAGAGMSLQFVRVQDTDGGDPLNIHTLGTGMNDQTFQDGTGAITFEVKWAANSEVFGWYDIGVNGNPNVPYPLFTAGNGLNNLPSPNYTTVSGLSRNFGFYITTSDGGGTNTWYSQQSLNISGNLDHMVMYRVDKYQNGVYVAGQEREWILAFEDLNLGDADYQDVVVSMKTNAVPLPAAVWSGMAMLGGLGVFGAWRRKVRSALGTR